MPRRPGFCVGLYYVALDSVELNIERVKRRVEKGGHDIPADVIDRRYWGSLDKLSSALKYADEALLIDNSGLEPREVCRVSAGKIVSQDVKEGKYLHGKMMQGVYTAYDMYRIGR